MKSKQKSSSILSRYTTLAVLIDILERSCITLLSPDTWSDRNDREVMREYQQRRKLSCLLAICFSRGEETIHHWSAYANGCAGCRIDFDLAGLVAAVSKQSGFRHDNVTYRKVNMLREQDLSDERRPFIKRWPYHIEKEYRIIFESSSKSDVQRNQVSLPISMDCIRSITMSQTMPEAVFKTIKAQTELKLRTRISRSTLFENRTWINKFLRQ